MIFRLANESDDVQLRRLMREAVMPGHIRMTYAREPNFFSAYEHSDEDTQVIAAENDKEIVGVACRSIRKLLVNGKPVSYGYLSGLRLKSSAQNTMALARGYAFLRTLHKDGRVPAYVTTIVDGNKRAQSVLASGRAKLPQYTPMGNYLTHVIPVKRHMSVFDSNNDIQIKRATEVSGKSLTSFLLQEGAKRQFFPVCDFNGPVSGIPLSIGLKNILVAENNRNILGTMSIWDQKNYKQHIVEGYSGAFHVIRPLFNLWLRARQLHPLPEPGQQLRYGAAGMICVKNNNIGVFATLLNYALALASKRGFHQFAVGLHENDPLVPAIKNFFHVLYRSCIYLVSWKEDSQQQDLNKSLIPYLELGTL